MKNKKIEEIRKEISENCKKIKRLTDLEFKKLVETGIFNEILFSISDPNDSEHYENLQERLLKNKNRLSFLARLRLFIENNYSFKGNVDGKSCYISPFPYQWLNHGVIFTQGVNKWIGLIGFYDNMGDLYYAKSKKNFKEGDKIDLQKDLFFDFFYQKIENMNEIDSKEKKEIIERVKKIETEKEPKKRTSNISKFLRWLDEKSDRIWYQTVKALFDSLSNPSQT